MSRHIVLSREPGETPDDFVRRVVAAAPPLTTDLAASLRALLPATPQQTAGPTASPQHLRAAA